MEQKVGEGYPWEYWLTGIFCYLVINQGGYFAGGIISAGLLIALSFFGKKAVEIRKLDFFFLLFSLWFLFCSLRPGFDVRYVAKGLIPLSCLAFKLLLRKTDPRRVLEMVVKVSFYITIAAILVCVYSCIRSKGLVRLTFPFQYANASGIYFGVMFILSAYADYEWAKKRQLVFFVGLLLTQSVGAIGLTVLAELFLSRNKKRTILMLALLLVGAVLLRGRIYQSMGTFLERFLQNYDGLVCLAHHPVFGVGAGRWELAKGLYQSGFYGAKEIHGGLIQIGVDSGVIGLALFLGLFVYYAFKRRLPAKVFWVAVLMVLFHGCLDFTLAFLVFGFLVILLLECGEDKEEVVLTVRPLVGRSVGAVLLAGFLILSVGMYQIKKLDGIHIVKKHSLYVSYYETHPLSQKSLQTKENYAKALYALGEKGACLQVLQDLDILSPDMVVLKKGCKDSWEEILPYLDEQPYQTSLYRTLYYHSEDELIKRKTKEKLDRAIDSMSFLGKILFNFKGEEIL